MIADIVNPQPENVFQAFLCTDGAFIRWVADFVTGGSGGWRKGELRASRIRLLNPRGIVKTYAAAVLGRFHHSALEI